MTTVQDFKDQIAAEFMASEAAKKLYGFPAGTKFSDYFPTVSIESVLIYVFAFGLWMVNTLLDTHRNEVSDALTALKPHTAQWLANKAKIYQQGYDLPKDENGLVISDVYKTIDHEKQIIKYSVAKEVGSIVVVKVAKYTSTDDHSPKKLSGNELAGIKQYFSQIKDCGVPLAVISNDPNLMKIEVVVYYNPMLLFPNVDSNGKVLALNDGQGVDIFRKNIQQAIENLPFNGDLRKSAIESAIEDIPGADIVDVTGVFVKSDEVNYSEVVGYTTPDSGYFKLEELTITAKPYSYGEEI